MGDHLVDQMEFHEGIGDYLEDFVEQAHQYGVKYENRTRGLTRSKAYKSHSNWDWRSNQLKIIQARRETNRRNSMRRRRGAVDGIIMKKNQRLKNRMYSLIRVESVIYSPLNDYSERKI